MSRALLIGLLVLGGSASALAQAEAAPVQEPAPTLTDRLDAVDQSTFASAAEGEVAQARGALARAEGLREAGDEAAAARAEAIALAATHLAERLVARAFEHSERDAVAHRLVAIRERLELALVALRRVREEASRGEAGVTATEAAVEEAEQDDPEGDEE